MKYGILLVRNDYWKWQGGDIYPTYGSMIRKVNEEHQILGLNLEDGNPLDKVCAYADDIVFIT